MKDRKGDVKIKFKISSVYNGNESLSSKQIDIRFKEDVTAKIIFQARKLNLIQAILLSWISTAL